MNKRQLFWFPIFQVHVLLREMLRRLTFEVVVWLFKWLLLWVVDFLLILVARVLLGDTSTYGLTSPAMGPLELKNKCGKTPVLEVGTLAKIRKGQIKVLGAIESFTSRGTKFRDGQEEEFDTVIPVTGYRSNVSF